MILLEPKDYNKLTEPLKEVTINNLFARTVVEKHIPGKVYVDNPEQPRTFYVVHPYGMSLLFGDWRNAQFNAGFRNYALNTNGLREKHEWMQAFPKNWDDVLSDLFGKDLIKSANNTGNVEKGIIELNTRVNFRFNPEKYSGFRTKHDISGFTIVRTDQHIFGEMKGSVVPAYFWTNAADFVENGIGFSLFSGNKLAATVYSAFIHDDKLELGIETVQEFRGKGFAETVCSAMIDYCLDNNLEPIWACKLENYRSYKLAQKLGFDPIAEIPFYRLSK